MCVLCLWYVFGYSSGELVIMNILNGLPVFTVWFLLIVVLLCYIWKSLISCNCIYQYHARHTEFQNVGIRMDNHIINNLSWTCTEICLTVKIDRNGINRQRYSRPGDFSLLQKLYRSWWILDGDTIRVMIGCYNWFWIGLIVYVVGLPWILRHNRITVSKGNLFWPELS